MLDRSKGRRQTKRGTKTDAGSSVISSDLKHRANDARDGLSSYSNRRDQSSLNGCCTAIWKANGKTTTLSLFLGSLFPKTEIALCGGIVLEEALDLSFDRLLMMMMRYYLHSKKTNVKLNDSDPKTTVVIFC